jgi:hypothetical protein
MQVPLFLKMQAIVLRIIGPRPRPGSRSTYRGFERKADRVLGYNIIVVPRRY